MPTDAVDQSCSGIKFLGASVSSASLNLGWGGEASTLSVILVEDNAVLMSGILTEDGEIVNVSPFYGKENFSKPIPGSPCYIRLDPDQTVRTDPEADPLPGEFGGIIQQWKQSHNNTTNPIFNVTVNDPREILAGSVIITDNYIGLPSFTLPPNVCNVYGSYLFGEAGVNDIGMPWNSIKPILDTFTFNFRNQPYKINLDKLPNPPSYYRITGKPTVTVLEAIDQLCMDAGQDYFVTMSSGTKLAKLRQEEIDAGMLPSGFATIHINTVDRTKPASNLPDRINYFISKNSGTVSEYTYGQELRNEINNVMVFGAPVDDLFQATPALIDYSFPLDAVIGTDADGNDIVNRIDTIQPFWGYGVDGNPIVSRNNFNLDVRHLNWPLLGPIYSTHVNEMQAVLGGQTVWEAYISYFKPALANAIGLYSQFAFDIIDNAILNDTLNLTVNDILNSKPEAARRFSKIMQFNMGQNVTIIEENINRLFNFLQQVAQTHYGKKFLVQIPTPAKYLDATTGKTVTSLEPTQSAWYESNMFNQQPLNLEGVNKYIFQDEQLKFEPFVRFGINSSYNVDASFINNQGYAIQPNPEFNSNPVLGPVSPSGTPEFFLYIKASVGDRVIFLNQNITPEYSFNSNFFQVNTDAIRDITNTFTATVELTLDNPIYVIPSSGFASDIGLFNLFWQAIVIPEDNPNKDKLKYNKSKIFDNILKSAVAGNLNLPTANPVLIPDFAAIPLRNNTTFYGPWVAGTQWLPANSFSQLDPTTSGYNFFPSGNAWTPSGTAVFGKVDVSHNSEFNPWNYGGYAVMNLAGQDYVERSTNNQAHQEMGSVTVAGLPTKELGQILTFDGPLITNINIDHDLKGVTTTYNMQTYTRRFGDYGKDRQERFRRYGKALNQTISALQNTQLYQAPRYFRLGGVGGTTEFDKKKGNLASNKSDVAGANFIGGQGEGTVVAGTSMSHFIQNSNADLLNTGFIYPSGYDSAYPSGFNKWGLMAGVDARGFFRPYSTDPSGYISTKYAPTYSSFLVSGVLPSGKVPDLGYFDNLAAYHPNRDDLNPYKTGHDMFVISGSGYVDPKDTTAYQADVARPMALRGPLMVAGWGYTTLGLPVPNRQQLVTEVVMSGGTVISSGIIPSGSITSFHPNYLTDKSLWKVGPVDLRWDELRHVWATARPDLGVVIALSGNVPDVNTRPTYVCRRSILPIETNVNLSKTNFKYSTDKPFALSDDVACINIQEGFGGIHTIGVGSLVMLYQHGGIFFMNEHVRTFTRQTGYGDS